MSKKEQALFIAIICLAVLLITTSALFIRGLKDKNENLKTQNAQLKEQIKIMEGDIAELNESYQA